MVKAGTNLEIKARNQKKKNEKGLLHDKNWIIPEIFQSGKSATT